MPPANSARQIQIDAGHAEPDGGAEVHHRLGQVEERLAAGDAGEQAAQDDQHAERDDEAVQPEPDDQQRVDDADQRARPARVIGMAQPPGQQPEPVAGADGDGQPGRDAGGEADGGLQRQVHLAGDQDHRLGQHQQRDLGHGLQDVDQVVGLQEDRVDELPDDRDDDDRRDQGEVAQPGEGDAAGHAARPVAEPRRLGRADGAAVMVSGIDGHSFHRGDEVVVVPAAGQSRRRRGPGTSPGPGRRRAGRRARRRRSRTPVPASATCSTLPRRNSLDRTSTPAVGVISTSSRGSLASARAMTTFCWLPPDRPDTGSPGPGVLIARSSIIESAMASRRPGAEEPGRPSRSRDGQGGVVGDRHARHEALVVPVLRHEADAAASAARTSPGAQAAARDRRSLPASAARSPTMVSASSVLPLPPEPARPTISPARTWNDTPSNTPAVDRPVARRGRRRRSAPGAVLGPRRVQAAGLAGHRGDELAARQLGDRGGDDVAGVAEHRDRVADLVDLLQVVADEQEGDALLLQRHACGRTAGRWRPRRAGRSARRG